MNNIPTFDEFLNESNSLHIPYQIDDKRGRELYAKATKAINNEKWSDANNKSDDNYVDKFSLKKFIKQTKMTIEEIEELSSNYGDESWSMYFNAKNDEINIEQD